MTLDTRPGKLKTIADTRAWVRAFFDGTVRGDWAGLKRLVDEAGKARPEVTATVFGKLWPEQHRRRRAKYHLLVRGIFRTQLLHSAA
jgi:hypothetical protein